MRECLQQLGRVLQLPVDEQFMFQPLMKASLDLLLQFLQQQLNNCPTKLQEDNESFLTFSTYIVFTVPL